MVDAVQTYEAKIARRDRRRREVRNAARDIGRIPEVVNPERRAAAAASFRTFADTYFGAQFSLPWSADHVRVGGKIERAVLHGGLFAMAMPRGFGKSTMAEVASLWAVLFGYRAYVVLIGATADDATSKLDSIKTELATNELLAEDFPEAVYPIQALEGIAHRAAGQVCCGDPTYIGWTSREIVLPTIAGARSSGAVLQVAGITGTIRGMRFKRANGTSIRPELVVVDDPQTDESARSVSQSQARLAVLTGAVLGLAGPGKKIAGIMPCTVIKPGDMADRILDSKKHPEWNGERTKLVYSWPTNEKLWEEYARIRAESLRETGTIAAATQFYADHRAEMDEGARVAWPERFNPDELSAIQNAINLRLTDEAAFFAEYQNEPLPETQASDESFTADLVASRLSGLGRGVLPAGAQYVTAMIDVSQNVLWWLVMAWSDACDGVVVDYGAFPDQGRAYFTLRDAKVTLARTIKGAGLEGQIAGGLEVVTQDLFARTYLTVTGTQMRIGRMLVDANWGQSTETVYEFCRRSPHSALLLPSHGRGIGASSLPMAQWSKKPGEKAGFNWRIAPAKRGLRAITYDTNHWKSFVAARVLTHPGDPGAFALYGKDPERHRMLADHLTAEHRVRTSGRGRTVDEWKLKPGRDNHWLDDVVGCAVAASVLGMPPAPVRRTPGAPATPGKSDRMSFSALQRAAREKRTA